MNIYLMYFLIIVITTIIFLLIGDKIKAIRLSGILTISSSILLIITTFIIKIFINNSINFVNLSFITNYLFIKFIYTSIILLIIGLLEILISKYMYKKNTIATWL